MNEWTLTVCVTLIVSVIFSLLLPSGAAGKFAKIIITVFIMISFLVPFESRNFKIELPDADEISEKSGEIENSSYSAVLEKNIDNLLDENGYENCVVKAQAKVDGEEITLSKLIIYIPDEYNKKDVKTFLFDEMGLNAEVYGIGD